MNLTPEQQALADWLKQLRPMAPPLTPEQLNDLLPVSADLIAIIAEQDKQLATYRVWAWSATALALFYMAMWIFDVRLMM